MDSLERTIFGCGVRAYGDACDVIKPTQAEAREGQSESWVSFCLETGVSLGS